MIRIKITSWSDGSLDLTALECGNISIEDMGTLKDYIKELQLWNYCYRMELFLESLDRSVK